METDIDGILVWGATKEEHNQRLKAALQRCNDILMTLNKGKKCRFGSSKVVYLGHIISAEGISPDPEKVKAINQMPLPEDKKGVERLLGFLNYVAKFIHDLSSITQPIRELLMSICASITFPRGNAYNITHYNVAKLHYSYAP